MRECCGFVCTLILSGMMSCGGNPPATNNSTAEIPAAPTALTATSGEAQITLSWSASSYASGYHVKRGTVSGGPYTVLSSPVAASYVDTTASIGTAYYYVVSAYNINGESGNSAEVTATPSHTPATYYVSPAGSDTSPGTIDQPFATVQYAVNRLYAGDTLNLRAGSYHESVSVPRSGTAMAPITIQAYSGETPTLIGAQAVSGPWSLYSGSIYMAPWSTQPLQVFSDGHLLNEARWPNTGVEDFTGMTYATADAGNATSLTKANLPAVDLTGAWIRIMAGQEWVAYDRQIATDDQSTGVLAWTAPVNALSELIPRRGNPFFIYGKLELLDAPGEWWWDSSAQMLYVWTQDGASPSGRIEAGVASAVLDLSGQSNVVVNGVQARGGWFDLQNSVSCTVENFQLYAPNALRAFNGYAVSPIYLGGIDASGSNNLIDGGLVQFAGRSGIHLAGTGNTVKEVTIEDQDLSWSSEGGIMASDADQALIQNNTIQRTALAGIVMGPHAQVLNNLVQNNCLFAEDCGNLNAWSMDAKGTEIAYNILRGNQARWGAAIYLDAGSQNFYLHDNLAEQILWNGTNITGVNTIENNTFLDVQHQGISYVPGTTAVGADWSAGIAKHNWLGEPFPVAISLVQPTSIIPDYSYYTAYVTLTPPPGPRRVEVDWPQMAQGAWSQNQVPMDLSQVNAITFSLEQPASAFAYAISNLRLLPTGGSGDTGAVAVDGGSWTVSCNGGSTCAVTTTGSTSWGDTGSSVFNGQNVLTAPLPSTLTNLSGYRGIAFELSGTASRTYDFQGYQAADNGPDAASGRGATLPTNIGADKTYVAHGRVPRPTRR
jgi:hypothetical protein